MRRGNAYVLGSQHQQQVLEIVFGKNRNGPFRVKPAKQKSLAQAAHRVERLTVAECAPVAIRAALSRERPLRSNLRPVRQPIGQDFRIRAKGLIRLNQKLATIKLPQRSAGAAQPHRPHTLPGCRCRSRRVFGGERSL